MRDRMYNATILSFLLIFIAQSPKLKSINEFKKKTYSENIINTSIVLVRHIFFNLDCKYTFSYH